MPDCLIQGSTIFNKQYISKEEEDYLKVGKPISYGDDFEKTEQLKRLIIYGFYKNIKNSIGKLKNVVTENGNIGTLAEKLIQIKYTEENNTKMLDDLCNFISNLYPLRGYKFTVRLLVNADPDKLLLDIIFFLHLLSRDLPAAPTSRKTFVVPVPPRVQPPQLPSISLGGASLQFDLISRMISKDTKLENLYIIFKNQKYKIIKNIMLDDIDFAGGTNLPCEYGVKQLFFGKKNIFIKYHTRLGNGGVIKNKRKRRKSKRKGARKSKRKGARKSKRKGRGRKIIFL